MPWMPLTVRDLNDQDSDILYPIPDGTPDGITLDEHDGRTVHSFVVTTIELLELGRDGAGSETLLKAEGIKAVLYVTDSRVAIACTKYDKGGGWYGGVTALALNAASKAMAASRRKGKVLVGHIRYPWLSSAGYTTKTGWLSDEELRIAVSEKTGGEEHTFLLDLKFPKGTSAEAVAREITGRAARYRLRNTTMDSDEERAGIEALVTPPPLTPKKGSFSTWRFPSRYFARTSTAYGNRDDSAEPNPSATAEPNPSMNWWEASTGAPANTPQPAVALAETSATAMASEDSNPASWLPDPLGRHELRYWDGTEWTSHISDNGVTERRPPRDVPNLKEFGHE